jgi:hypothetical protein
MEIHLGIHMMLDVARLDDLKEVHFLSDRLGC